MGAFAEALSAILERLEGHRVPTNPHAYLQDFTAFDEASPEAEGDELYPRVLVLMPAYAESLIGNIGGTRRINRNLNVSLIVESSRARHGIAGHAAHIEAVLDALDVDPVTGAYLPVLESATCHPRHRPVAAPESSGLDFSLTAELTLTVQLRSANRGERRTT